MTTLVILVEEESMKATLEIIMKKINTHGTEIFILAYEGARDLEKRLTNTLRNWRIPDVTFLVLRDNDNADCIERKQYLASKVMDAGVENKTTIRIVCQELESWFLGDRDALEAAGYVKQGSHPNSTRGVIDDKAKPSVLLENLNKTKIIGKIARAKEITPHMDLNKNHSASFNHTIKSLKTLLP